MDRGVTRSVRDALDEAVYRHPKHQPRQLRMSTWTANELRADGLADDKSAAGFRLVIDDTLPPGAIY